MTNQLMTYDGYSAKVEFDARDNLFVGHILGIEDVIGFHADTVQDLQKAFREAVDDYLRTCAAVGKRAQKPASGRLLLRIPPQVHQAAMIAAKSSGKSLNRWAAEVLERATQ